MGFIKIFIAWLMWDHGLAEKKKEIEELKRKLGLTDNVEG